MVAERQTSIQTYKHANIHTHFFENNVREPWFKNTAVCWYILMKKSVKKESANLFPKPTLKKWPIKLISNYQPIIGASQSLCMQSIKDHTLCITCLMTSGLVW